MKIHGKYRFIQDKQTLYRSDNLITTYGETAIMNRLLNDNYPPLTYIVLGKGKAQPKKLDLKLGNETVRKTATKKYNITNKTITLTASVEATEIKNITEIGTDNGEKLCSHDLFNPLNDLITSDSQITIEYTFYFETGTVQSDWTPSGEEDGIYYTYEPNKVTGVLETTTQSGYHRVDTKEELKSHNGAYYYNKITRNLYIVTTTRNNPGEYEIIIRS